MSVDIPLAVTSLSGKDTLGTAMTDDDTIVILRQLRD
jgi:hypothetical protein